MIACLVQRAYAATTLRMWKEIYLSASNQLGLDLGDAGKAAEIHIDPEEVRSELHAILAEARTATHDCPWDLRTFQYHKTVFPQMSNWLPSDEAEQLRFEFQSEVERIEALLAA
jgi:hypothetical protein